MLGAFCLFFGAEHGFSFRSGLGFFFLGGGVKSNVLFQIFDVAFAHRAAVDNKHLCVFMLSLSCKNPHPPTLSLPKTYPRRCFVQFGWRCTFILDSVQKIDFIISGVLKTPGFCIALCAAFLTV